MTKMTKITKMTKMTTITKLTKMWHSSVTGCTHAIAANTNDAKHTVILLALSDGSISASVCCNFCPL